MCKSIYLSPNVIWFEILKFDFMGSVFFTQSRSLTFPNWNFSVWLEISLSHSQSQLHFCLWKKAQKKGGLFFCGSHLFILFQTRLLSLWQPFFLLTVVIIDFALFVIFIYLFIFLICAIKGLLKISPSISFLLIYFFKQTLQSIKGFEI